MYICKGYLTTLLLIEITEIEIGPECQAKLVPRTQLRSQN